MDEDKAAFNARLIALQQDYVRQLPERLASIEAAWNGLTQTSWEVDTLRELCRAVHGLTGSGLTFGFGEISNAARACEVLLKEAVTASVKPAADQLNRMTRALDALHFAIASVAPVSVAPGADSAALAPGAEKIRPLLYLVEDDPLLLALLHRQISRYGFTVKAFERLAEVMAGMSQQKPVAVISDVNLPDNEGVAAQTYGAVRDASIPLIMISAQDDIETRLKAVRAGASAFLLKPVNLDELMDHVERLINPPATEAYRVLVVEDSLALGHYYAAALREAGMLVELVNDPMQAWTAIQRIVPELVLMDLYMPGCNGLELASVIRQQPSYVGIPIVFLSAENGNRKQLSALGLGDDDFLTKPVDAERLVHAVSTRAARARTLRAGMLHDGLTGALNHSAVIERLHSEISHAARQKTSLVAVLIDIDHFKAVNDTYGHLMGDQVLRSLTRLLRPRLRKSDSLGRYGGEEFLLIFPDTSVEAALRLVNELRVLFSETQHRSGGRMFLTTFSAGVAGWSPGMSAVDVVDAADQALYRSKRQGRNRVTSAKPPAAFAVKPAEEGGSEAWRLALEKLRAEFIDELPERVIRIESLVLALSKPDGRNESYEELYRVVHSLKGSGGTYGFPILSSICHQLEDRLKETEPDLAAVGERTIDTCLRYVDLLQQAVSQIVVGGRGFSEIESALEDIALELAREKRRGLVVVGSSTMLSLCMESLASLPVVLTAEQDGLRALERLLLERFDFLVTGNTLTGLNGTALVSALRLSDSMNREIPVVMVSSAEAAVPPPGLAADRVVVCDSGMIEPLQRWVAAQVI